MSDSDVSFTFGAATDDVIEAIQEIADNVQSLGPVTDRASAAMQAPTQAFASSTIAAYRAMTSVIASGWSGGLDQVAQAAQNTNAQIVAGADKASAQTLSLELHAVDAELRALRSGLNEKKVVLDAETQQHVLSEDQKFAALEAEMQREYAAETALLQKEEALGGLKASQAIAIENKIASARQKNDLDMVRLDEQSIAATQKAWDGYFSTLQGAFDSQWSGLLRGATTWSAAFKNVLSDLLVKFIETIEKMGFQWAAGEIAQTAATTSGAAARATAETSAASASSVATASSVLHSIAASAAETFAGIFGFLSPVMGPAAVGPATAGEATVQAAAAGVAAFAQGSWALPDDMLAQVHKGEMIVPASRTPWAQSVLANAARTSSPSGDVHVHHATNFNVTALDSRDVKRWLSGNGRTIVNTINSAVRDGAHLGLSRFGS